jgi:hypothetical protein
MSSKKLVTSLYTRYQKLILAKKISVLLIILASLALLVCLVRTGIQYLSTAAGEETRIYFIPSPQNMPPDATLSLMVDPNGEGIHFATIEVQFDNSKINLSQEIDTSMSPLLTTRASTASQANSTGKIYITGTLCDPTPPSQCDPMPPIPSSVFEFARLTFHSHSSAVNDQTQITINVPNVQIVNMGSTELEVTSTPAELRLLR